MTFDHLLGLTVDSALAILRGYGITDVETAMTAAPKRAGAPETDAEAAYTSLRVVAVQDDGRRLIVSRFHTGDPKPPIPPERNLNE